MVSTVTSDDHQRVSTALAFGASSHYVRSASAVIEDGPCHLGTFPILWRGPHYSSTRADFSVGFNAAWNPFNGCSGFLISLVGPPHDYSKAFGTATATIPRSERFRSASKPGTAQRRQYAGDANPNLTLERSGSAGASHDQSASTTPHRQDDLKLRARVNANSRACSPIGVIIYPIARSR